MVYELALKLGQTSPAAMLAAMRPSEFGLWCGLYRLDPWGESRADLRTGILASLLANIHRDTKARSTPFRPDEFMPYLARPAVRDLPPEPEPNVLERMRAWFGARIVKKPRTDRS